MQAWREADASEQFDYKAIRARLEKLRGLCAAGDVKGLLFVLNEGIHGNIDGMGHERLYQKARFGTKILIEAYVAEVVAALEKIAASRSIPREEKRDFFRRAQHCYGRSALLLSGSGSFLFFHVGVVKALWDEGVLPNILAGSSGGSIVAAIVRSEEHTSELQSLMRISYAVFCLKKKKKKTKQTSKYKNYYKYKHNSDSTQYEILD